MFQQSVNASNEANQLCGCSTTITTSLAPSIKQYRVENGRTYHQYKDGRKCVLERQLQSLKLMSN
jgi:hypothetical protein